MCQSVRGSVYRTIIISDKYNWLLPAGSLIAVTQSTQLTVHMHGRITVGSGKWYLSDIIMALNLLHIKRTVIGGACCLNKEQKRWICVERCATIRPAKTNDKSLLVSNKEHVYYYGIYSVCWPTHTYIIAEFTPSAGQHTFILWNLLCLLANTHVYYYGIYAVCWPTHTYIIMEFTPSAGQHTRILL